MSEETTAELVTDPPEVEEVETSVPETSEEGKAKDPTEPSKPEPFMIPKDRFNQVIRERNELRAQRQEMEQRIAEFEGRNKPQTLEIPDPSEYDSKEAYVAAVKSYTDQVAEVKSRTAVQAREQQAEVEKIVGGFNARLVAMEAENPRIYEAIDVFKDMEADMDPKVFRDIVADEDGPRIAWEIASDPSFAASIINATPFQAARLIAKRLSQPQSQVAPAKAPVPATRTVSGAAQASKNPSEMTDAEWYRANGFKG